MSRDGAASLIAYRRVSRQLTIATTALGVWITIVSLFFLLESLDYRGIVRRLAEWEFLHFDRYWPTLTFVAMAALFASPLLLLVWLLRVRQRHDERNGPARFDDRHILLNRLARLRGLFGGIAVGSLLAALIAFIMGLQQPGNGPVVRSVVVGSNDAVAPPDGRTVLTGDVDLGQVAQFNENLLLFKRTLYFAPILPGPGAKGPLRYFVEVKRNDVKGDYNQINFPKDKKKLVRVWRFHVPGISFTPYTQGVLRHNALPGEIVNLYRYAGFDVAKDDYVLFRARERLTWRDNVVAIQFALSAILSALATLVFTRRQRALKRQSSRTTDED